MKDVTKQVTFGNPDDEYLQIIECVCGKAFNWWEFIISIYEDSARQCPNCGRKFIFKQEVKIYEIED